MEINGLNITSYYAFIDENNVIELVAQDDDYNEHTIRQEIVRVEDYSTVYEAVKEWAHLQRYAVSRARTRRVGNEWIAIFDADPIK